MDNYHHTPDHSPLPLPRTLCNCPPCSERRSILRTISVAFIDSVNSEHWIYRGPRTISLYGRRLTGRRLVQLWRRGSDAIADRLVLPTCSEPDCVRPSHTRVAH